MNRRLVMATLACLLIGTLAGCAKKKADADKAGLRIVATTYPMFLFTRQVAAGQDGVAVELMLPAGAGCPHEYVLTTQDMQRLAKANVLVINGLGLDDVFRPAAARANPKLKIVDSSAGVTGLIARPDEHAHEGHEHHDHGDKNPHLFADPRMAAQVVRNIGRQLSDAHPPGRDRFTANAEAYAEELDRLADEFAAAGKRFANNKVVAQHDVFDYLARTAGFEVVAVIRDDPERAPSAAHKREVLEKIKSTRPGAILTEPQYPADEARGLAGEPGVNVQVVELDPVATGPVDPPDDYYHATMRANLARIQDALGRKEP